ncbi:hypothetical protein R9C00_11535 [Flammeovirgaceae bacterium SG7u.111]|nr:hypothetical protein [Flammeovirgaceae bacterium SG7u.132]WPO38084.1 hypothetical protein R9C00_11535 [Flammeovirgaceae bacterium SG7u.111]
MTLSEFKDSLAESKPPTGLSVALEALWWDGKGDWHKAHDYTNDPGAGTNGDWVHAYLHRKEGDEWNASYWYSRAGKSKPVVSLEEEWETMVEKLL